MIPVGTKVRLRTVNGGDCIVYVASTPYTPSYGQWFRHFRHDGTEWQPNNDFWVEATRIASVEVLP